MTTEAMAGLVFVPLLAACALLIAPRRLAGAVIVLAAGLPAVLLCPLTAAVIRDGVVEVALAGFAPPLGIAWRVDALSVLLLWLNAVVSLGATVHALTGRTPGGDRGRRFWPPWLLLIAGLNALLLSADLFNLYVALELVTLTAIALVAVDGKPAALKAAMRYLLLALMASLLYLLGVGLVYAATGTLDLYQAGQHMSHDLLPVTAFVLMLTGLLLKAAIFPLHVWLPSAHGNAPGPVSAMLSALVVKAAIYMIWRLWWYLGDGLELAAVATALGVLGAGAIIYGSLAALVQQRLKMIVAYSTVAQLGYLMLLFPLAGILAWQAVVYHALAHGLAKAALFLAAANILTALGTDRLRHLPGLDQRMPLDVSVIALAGVSIMGLPPSGGFLAKWMLLRAAWFEGAWGWLAVIALGGLLSAAYVFRVLAVMCFHPRVAKPAPPPGDVSRVASLVALALALLAIAIGFLSAPILSVLDAARPPVLVP